MSRLTLSLSAAPAPARLFSSRRLRGWLLLPLMMLLMSACGRWGGHDSDNASAANGASPTLNSQPAPVSAKDGESTTFSVDASGGEPITYQWYRNGVVITGATSATYTLTTSQLSDNGAAYTVVVTNAAGSVTSSPATLSVSPAAPRLATGPGSETSASNVEAVQGQSATFTVTVTGSVPMSFQWRRNGVPIDGANSASYILPAAASTDTGAVYDVVISNAAGTLTSAPFTLTVTPTVVAPSFAGQPQASIVHAGQPATFSVNAAGSAPLTYQWLRNGAPIAGATARSGRFNRSSQHGSW